MKTNVTMKQHVTEFVTKAEQIVKAGIVIQDDMLSIMLLGSLPTEYENFIVAMESRDVLPPLESLKRKLIEEEARQSNWSAKCNTDNNVLLLKNRSDRKQIETRSSARHSEKMKANKFSRKCLIVIKISTLDVFVNRSGDKTNRVM